MDLILSRSFVPRHNIALGDYALGFLDYLLDNTEIGQGFMNSGCRESNTMSDLLIREPLRHTAKVFLHALQVPFALLDGKQSILCSLLLGLFRFLSQSDTFQKT